MNITLLEGLPKAHPMVNNLAEYCIVPYSLEITPPPPFCWLGLATSMGGGGLIMVLHFMAQIIHE